MLFPRLLVVPLDIAPVPLIEAATRLLFSRLMKAHPGLFDRLGEFRSRRFAFCPTDLPLTFLVDPGRPSLFVLRKPDEIAADTSVEAPVFVLLALLEGRLDADAMFFSRDLTVTGDMEAMLAMRNALDDSNIDLPRDLSQIAGPLAPLLRRAASEFRSRVVEQECA